MKFKKNSEYVKKIIFLLMFTFCFIFVFKLVSIVISFEKIEVIETKIIEKAKQNEEYANIDTLPDYVKGAFIVIEDNDKITKFLVKNAIASKRGSIRIRDILQEQYLSMKFEKNMEERYGSKKLAKDKIMEIYINTVNFGENYNGIQSASNNYFNKDASELTVSETAVLVPITQNPSKLNPINYQEANNESQVILLEKMRMNGYITDEKYIEAINDDVYSRIVKNKEE